MTLGLEIQISYSPPDLFEEPVERERDGYSLHIDEGRAVARIPASGNDPQNINRVENEVRAFLRGAGPVSRRVVDLEPGHVKIEQRGRDGQTVGISVGLDAVMVAGDAADARATAEDGSLLWDTRAERIAARIEMAEASARHWTNPTARQLVEEYGRALADPDHELAHLYVIQEALEREFDGRFRKAADTLGIPQDRWKWMVNLCNDRAQGRHRGAKHPGKLKKATAGEIGEVRALAGEMIRAYLAYLDRS